MTALYDYRDYFRALKAFHALPEEMQHRVVEEYFDIIASSLADAYARERMRRYGRATACRLASECGSYWSSEERPNG